MPDEVVPEDVVPDEVVPDDEVPDEEPLEPLPDDDPSALPPDVVTVFVATAEAFVPAPSTGSAPERICT